MPNYTDSNSIRLYLKEIGKHPLLTATEELNLGRIAKTGTPCERKRAIDRLVTSNLRLGVSIAKKYLNNGVPFQDLIQEGSIGLYKAAEKFDYTKEYRFSTYAYRWVRQAMTRTIGLRSRMVQVPIGRMDTIAKINKQAKELSHKLGRWPSRKEIAAYVNMPIEELNTRFIESRRCISTDTLIGDGTTSLGDLFVSEKSSSEDFVWARQMREVLTNSMGHLTSQERTSLVLKYGLEGSEPLESKEVCAILGVNIERLRQIRRVAMIKMKRNTCRQQLEGLLCDQI